jgi:hypothetical protein
MKHEKEQGYYQHPPFIDRLLEAFIEKLEKEKREAEKDQEIQELLSKLGTTKNISTKEIIRVIKEELKD